MLFSTCLEYARTAPYDDPKKSHAVQLMTVVVRYFLSKNDLAGWEVMELFAGGVNQSDKFFNVFMFDSLLCVPNILTKYSVGFRHHYWDSDWRRERTR